MVRFRQTLAALAVAGALAAGAPVATVPAQPNGPEAHASCKRAVIGGHRKCIARGQYCSRRYQRDYHRYGYSCSKRDRNGRYHLTYY
jgi:hypothetical protein